MQQSLIALTGISAEPLDPVFSTSWAGPYLRVGWMVALILLSACAPLDEPVDPEHAGSPNEAEDIAQNWLVAVSTDGGDRGWSLLHPLTQQRLYDGDAQRYLNDVESIDWQQFAWQIVSPAVWDGNYLVMVSLPHGIAPAEQLADGYLMQPIRGASDVPQVAMTIKVDADGSRGVLGP